jgi:hypothetical protein
LIAARPVRFSPEHLDNVGASSSGQPQADQVFAYLEVFRNLACLNLLRQHTYREEYDYSYLEAFHDPEDRIMERVDACVQRLRLVLMCAGDTTPYLIMLTPEKAQKESPDFNTLHYCRNFDKILDWTKENEAEVDVKEGFPQLYSFAASELESRIS